MNIILILVTGCYGMMVMWMLRQWVRAVIHMVPAEFLPSRKITVIIPFRNEADVLKHLSEDLKNLRFPHNQREFIFVDDHSSDNGPKIIRHFCAETPGASLLSLTEETGKKAAVSLGISQSCGELIVTLDADMRVHRDWLQSISHYWEISGKRFVILPIAIASGRGLLNKFQVIETDSLIGSTGAFALADRPIMCNGGNLAFEKSLFHQLGGYEDNRHISSGDDIFLLQKCRKKHPEFIGWLHTPRAIAITAPCPTIRTFLAQRIRWGSKTKHYSDILPKTVALVVAVTNIMFIAGAIAFLFDLASALVLALAFSVKVLVDGIFIWKTAHFFNHRNVFWMYPVVALLYPFYIVVTAIAGLFYRPLWKGRKIKG